jgi:oligogalacturonide lyase
MPRSLPLIVLLALSASLRAAAAPATQPALPSDWIDPATGHRIIRLSRDGGSASLYFHQNAYTTEGDLMIISTPSGLATVNLKTRAIQLVAPGVSYSTRMSSGIEVGRKTRTVYYERRTNGGTTIYATQLDTKATRVIAALPFFGDFGGVNADETLLFGDYTVGGRARPTTMPAAMPTTRPQARRGRGGPGGIKRFFTVNIQTGEIKTFFPTTDFLNHTQCSPTDPTLGLYCHEGNWAQVDRIWTIHLDGTGNRLMHKRTMPMEIAGHEFFGGDGSMVWYDLQTPESGVFWLAGVNVYTGQRIRYPLQRSQWSVHYNVSRDGRLFAGDGGGPNGVSNRTPDGQVLNPPGNGQWLYLFTPRDVPPTIMKVGGEDVNVGSFTVEKLVDLSHHDYTLEPNLTFTPDGKWIVFRSNMRGPIQVYAVEVAKAQ